MAWTRFLRVRMGVIAVTVALAAGTAAVSYTHLTLPTILRV